MAEIINIFTKKAEKAQIREEKDKAQTKHVESIFIDRVVFCEQTNKNIFKSVFKSVPNLTYNIEDDQHDIVGVYNLHGEVDRDSAQLCLVGTTDDNTSFYLLSYTTQIEGKELVVFQRIMLNKTSNRTQILFPAIHVGLLYDNGNVHDEENTYEIAINVLALGRLINIEDFYPVSITDI